MIMDAEPIWLTVANARKGLTVATTCDTLQEAIERAQDEAEDEDALVAVEQGGRLVCLLNAENFDD